MTVDRRQNRRANTNVCDRLSVARRALLSAALVFTAFTACGPSVQDLVEDLADPERREAARQELLLTKDRAVGPLLKALDDPRHAGARSELVEVLISLMTRVDDKRISEALNRLLVQDGDPRLRARIAQRMGLFKRAEAIGALLKALDDESGEVRYQTLMALGELEEKLDESQREGLREKVRSMVADTHAGARLEALIRVESFVNKWISEAGGLAIKAQLVEADSLFHRALAYFPHSKHAAYQLGRFYFDNGQEEKGMEVLRRHGMLLDVPRLKHVPEIDGRLDEAVWQRAARADTLYKFFWGGNFAAPPAEVQSTFYVGYTAEALYIGFRGHDDHPDSLVAKITESDPTKDGALSDRGTGALNQIWSDDCIELLFDANLDHRSYTQFFINSLGVREDNWESGSRNWDWSWSGDVQVAAHVGEDFWSLEFKLNFGQKELPRPEPGAIWGFNLVRNFRGEQYNQWVRTYGSGLQPDHFGMLVFK